MSILYVHPHSLKSHYGLPWKPWYNQRAFILEDTIIFALNGPIEQIYTHNKISYVFNVGLITPWMLVYPMFFPHL